MEKLIKHFLNDGWKKEVAGDEAIYMTHEQGFKMIITNDKIGLSHVMYGERFIYMEPKDFEVAIEIAKTLKERKVN